MRVIIDSLYAGDARGTGISTYARTLARALRHLGHDIAWLSGAAAESHADKLADAAALGDRPQTESGPRRYLTTARRMLEGLGAANVTARRVDAASLLDRSTSVPSAETYLAPHLFTRAHYRHMLRREFLEVAAPSGIDVLHLTAPLPVRMPGVRKLATIHDLVPLRLPDATPDNKAEFAARVRRTVNECDRVLTVSEASKRDIVDLLDVDPDRISVTWQPTDFEPLPETERANLPRTLARMGLEPDRYALFVGALEPKKNIRRLIEAFLDADTDLHLVICGARAWMWERELGDLDTVLGSAARERIRFMGYAPREDLPYLYAGARLSALPSLYEGFGLPALDAMRAGCPLIVSNTGSLPEICGDAALFVDPYDRAALRDAIGRLAADTALGERLGAAGRIQAERFSFERYVAALGEAYARI